MESDKRACLPLQLQMGFAPRAIYDFGDLPLGHAGQTVKTRAVWEELEMVRDFAGKMLLGFNRH